MTLSLPSPSLSRLHARLRRAPLGWFLEDPGSRNGTYLNGQRVERGLLGADDILEVGHVFIMLRDFDERTDEPARDLDVGDLDASRWVFERCCRRSRPARRSPPRGALAGGSAVPRRDRHRQGGAGARDPRAVAAAPGPFVAVNCGTLTDGLAESQLFGHVKGAFSGAVADSPGFVRAADRGTLLLDEVGDLAPAAQGALLRVLQEREVVPVGRAHAQQVDVRFVATTPRALDVGVGRDRFRSDLFARLSGFVYPMTPLRERREDLGLFIAALLRKAGVVETDGPRIAPDLRLALLRHDWPLNVRELEAAADADLAVRRRTG